VTGTAAGTVTITAKVNDKTASIGLTVINANLGGITTAASDAFLLTLVANLSGAIGPGMDQAIALCQAGAAEGNFAKLDDCLAQSRGLVSAAADPTDRALVASESLFLDFIERQQNLDLLAQQGGTTR
jgi:hypothetical protein